MARKTGGREATTGVIEGQYVLGVGNPGTPAPEGWRWTALTDVARLESGHTPSRKKPEYWGGEIPWIGIKDATSNHGRTIHETMQHTNDLGIANSAARVLPANTVCLSRTASVGYVIVMGRPMATSQDFANWVCSENLDYRFLKFALLAERDSFSRFSYGSTHQTIYYPELKAFHICLPPIAEQKRIADILQSLDDKIELNRRMSATLEEMARALYRSWFVDFDPVQARALGQPPAHMDPTTAALFPDSFGPDGLPKGWERRPFSDQVAIISGGTPKTGVPEYWGGEVPWYSVVDAPETGAVFVLDTEKKITAAGFDGCSAKMISRGTTIISARGTVGKLAMAACDMVFNQSCYGLQGT
ncbi:type I restriction enzyme, S subunit [Rhodovulum sp. ES.010]|uniref:restriction endonuclease subunit S n=1 Tax=Rhodovulum sp. ES.010 TaxID=1882821 RepID=UPI00092B51ED|nr:restriction endonuclease subunit S [Rhodovulum sp. ES.010]SIO39550.1 type I restriction enzyme, S subunit [Rhodovulum sp. ES.010]